MHLEMNIPRRTLIRGLLSIVMVVYLCVAVSMTRSATAATPFTDMQIVINDSLATHFIEAGDIDAALGNISKTITRTPRSEFNTLALENTLEGLDRVEDAHCLVLADGTLRVEVTPMIPVARVFPDHGESYYVSAGGKRITSSRLHPIDVPIVSGHIRRPADVLPMLPMFAKIKADDRLNAWASSVTVAKNGDIIIIPAVVGHTVTIGDTSNIDDKLERVRLFYAKVMPVKGWEFYDDISVKYKGRVVATRRHKKPVDNRPITELDGIIDEILDDDVMLSTPDAPATQTKPQPASATDKTGQKASKSN